MLQPGMQSMMSRVTQVMIHSILVVLVIMRGNYRAGDKELQAGNRCEANSGPLGIHHVGWSLATR